MRLAGNVALIAVSIVLVGCGSEQSANNDEPESTPPSNSSPAESKHTHGPDDSTNLGDTKSSAKPVGMKRFEGPDTLGLARVAFTLDGNPLSMEAPEGAEVSVDAGGSRALIQRFDSDFYFDMRWRQDETRVPLEETLERRRSFIEGIQGIEIQSEWIDAIFGVSKSPEGQYDYQVYMWKECGGNRYYFTANASEKEIAELCLKCASTLELNSEGSSVGQGRRKQDSFRPPGLDIPVPRIEQPSADLLDEVYRVTAEEFNAEFKANPDKIIEKYGGSPIELTGYLYSVTVGRPNRKDILIFTFTRPPEEVGKGFALIPQVMEPNQWRKASPGGPVTIRAVVDPRYSYLMGPAKVVRAEEGPCPILTSEALMTVFMMDAKVFRDKYEGEHVVVSGAFSPSAPKAQLGPYYIAGVMQGAEEQQIGVHCALSQGYQFENLIPGQQILVIGELKIGDHQLVLTFCSRLDLLETADGRASGK